MRHFSYRKDACLKLLPQGFEEPAVNLVKLYQRCPFVELANGLMLLGKIKAKVLMVSNYRFEMIL